MLPEYSTLRMRTDEYKYIHTKYDMADLPYIESKDLQTLLSVEDEEQISFEPLSLWDDKRGTVPYGINYSER